MDDKILSLYAKGMTTREIVATFKKMMVLTYRPLISKVTDAVIQQVIEWQSRPLDTAYPIVYLDCIVVKIRQDKQVINKAIYLAIQATAKKWTMPIRNWRAALTHFMIVFDERLSDYQ